MPVEAKRQKEGMQSKSTVTVLDNVSFTSPDRLLFYGVNLSVRKGETVAITGESGVGKSTLLKIILGKTSPDTGTASLTKGVRVSYVPQDIEDIEADDSISIKDLFYKARGLDIVERRKEELEVAMGAPENASKLQELLHEYSDVSEKFEEMGGYAAESEMDKILAGLKLDPIATGHITPDTRLNEVSSGQRTRALIGQALFANADLLILDDPTSHLDQDSVTWLSGYLKESRQASIIATNNIPFINDCSNKIVEITDFGRVLAFEGNYHDYAEKRDLLLEAERSEAKAVKAERDRLEETLLKFKSKQVFKKSAKMATRGAAMQTRIDRLDDDYSSLPGSKQVFRTERVGDLKFRSEQRSGDAVLLIRNLVKKYGDFLALNLSHLDLIIRRGETLLISGENGSGKSTLMRMMASLAQNGTFNPDEGELQLGVGVKAGYYSPDHTGISKENPILDEVVEASTTFNEGEASSTLHYWGFPKGTIRVKEIEQLSAGEKKQLALAKLMIRHPNLLLLDEPTDYLKPEIVERLINALDGYDGTVVVVSHNREFVDQLTIHRELTLPEGKIILRKELK